MLFNDENVLKRMQDIYSYLNDCAKLRLYRTNVKSVYDESDKDCVEFWENSANAQYKLWKLRADNVLEKAFSQRLNLKK